MRKNMDLDWFNILKTETVLLSMQLKSLRDNLSMILDSNTWILEDVNLFESFSKLNEMIIFSNRDLTTFVAKIKHLDNQPITFEIEDIKDEFDFIRENIYLEISCFENMIKYMKIITNQKIDTNIQQAECKNYHEYDIYCYNQMKMNNDGLKKLRKERRD